jgi:hypothetical protein
MDIFLNSIYFFEKRVFFFGRSKGSERFLSGEDGFEKMGLLYPPLGTENLT